MTDDKSIPVFDAGDFMARYETYRLRAVGLHASNKERVMTALARIGITSVAVAFDGVGDSGQIENIEARAGEEAASLPDFGVELARTEFGSEEVTTVVLPLTDAIERLCYALLECEHGGWENNSGAYGEFVFDVETGAIVLDFNYRIETSENHSHLF